MIELKDVYKIIGLLYDIVRDLKLIRREIQVSQKQITEAIKSISKGGDNP